jgi:hypothetical protein
MYFFCQDLFNTNTFDCCVCRSTRIISFTRVWKGLCLNFNVASWSLTLILLKKICGLMFDVCALVLIWVYENLDISFSRRHGLHKNKRMPFTEQKPVYFEKRYM